MAGRTDPAAIASKRRWMRHSSSSARRFPREHTSRPGWPSEAARRPFSRRTDAIRRVDVSTSRREGPCPAHWRPSGRRVRLPIGLDPSHDLSRAGTAAPWAPCGPRNDRPDRSPRADRATGRSPPLLGFRLHEGLPGPSTRRFAGTARASLQRHGNMRRRRPRTLESSHEHVWPGPVEAQSAGPREVLYFDGFDEKSQRDRYVTGTPTHFESAACRTE